MGVGRVGDKGHGRMGLVGQVKGLGDGVNQCMRLVDSQWDISEEQSEEEQMMEV